MSGRRSAQARLAGLGRVFSVDELEREQALSAKAVSVYLSRWQAQGRIGRLGPRCGLWVNFSQPGGPRITWADRVAGARMKHPRAVVGGRSALRSHGWIGEGEDLVSLVVPQGGSRAQLDGFSLVFRPAEVHDVLAGLARFHPGIGLPVLPGEVVVADLLAREEEVPLAWRQRVGDQSDLVRRLARAQSPRAGRA